MRTSEQIDQISKALAAAQAEMKNPEKNQTAEIPTKNGGSYEYNYADLAGTIDAIRAPLSKQGLSHTFGTVVEGQHTICYCRLMHSSGQWFQSEAILPVGADIKGMGGNITYLRRYLLTALVGAASEDDLDSEPEHENAKYERRAPKATQPPAQQRQAPPAAAAPPKAGQAPQQAPSGAVGPHGVTEKDRDHVLGLVKSRGWTAQQALDVMKALWQKEKILELEKPQLQELTAVISSQTFEDFMKANAAFHEDRMEWEKKKA